MKTILLCVETNPSAKTDQMYIEKTIKQLYTITNEIKISYEYFDGKDKYNNAKLQKKINGLKRMSKNCQFVVIYCIDTDKIDMEVKMTEKYKEIKSFCDNKGFDLVWFYRDIEEVYYGHTISKKDKIMEAKKFNNMDGLGKATIQTLCANDLCRYKSNLLLVLDKYLTRK